MSLTERIKICEEIKMVYYLSKYADPWVSVIEWFEKYYKRNPIKTSNNTSMSCKTVCYGADTFKVEVN